MKEIPFLVALPEENAESDQMGLFRRGPNADIGFRQVPIEILKKNLAGISSAMLNVLGDIKQVGQFKLKEITIEVEVSADGGVSLIGTANLGGKGAISLTFSE
ncbi:MAG: Pepco domain-containing protein [Methanothrix sp.]